MGLRVTRSFLKSAYKRNGLRIEDATEQEMRSLVCAQCHAEYYFQGEDRILTLPWDQGYTVENIEAYYDSINFTDFTHKLSRAHLIKAQHPDFELFQMGIHGQRGVSCGECHMPAVGEDENRYNNHHIKSPLAMIDRTCQACHRESEETLRKDVYERQNKVYAIRMRVEEELTKPYRSEIRLGQRRYGISNEKRIKTAPAGTMALGLRRGLTWGGFPRAPRSHTYLGQRTR